MARQVPLHSRREHRDPILGPLAVPDDDQVGSEVDVLDAEARTFEQAQAGAVEEQGHETRDAVEVLEDSTDLVACHDDGQVLRPPGAYDVVEPGQVLLEHHAVEKEQRGQRLVLGGGGDVTHDGERREELRDFPGPHLGGMALTVEEDVAPDPAHVGLLGPPAAVEGLERLSDAVEEPGRRRACRADVSKGRARAGWRFRQPDARRRSQRNLCHGHADAPLFGSRGTLP
jgi:hypothetical protein